MIQLKTILDVADNTGAKLASCIQMLGDSRKRYGRVGDIVVAIVDNEFTVKYLDREKSEFVLKPANKAYPVIRPRGGLEIFGVMAGLARRTR